MRESMDALIRLPACDEWGVPLEKMPNCPACGEDELGMITPGFALCYACRRTFVPSSGVGQEE